MSGVPNIFYVILEMVYTNAELAEMHLIYGEAHGNALEASRIYHQRFPNRRQVDRRLFSRIHQRLVETGSLQPRHGGGRRREVLVPAFEEEVLERFEDNPSTSTRAVAHAMGTNHQSVWRVLNEQLLHPFHLQKVQTLEPQDYPQRVEFCEFIRRRQRAERNFHRSILFTDEASFNRDGYFNSKNTHLWDDQNPHGIMKTRNQRKFSVNLWAGIIDNHLIGPYLLPPRLNGVHYLAFLQNVLPVLLEDLPLGLRDRMWFQHDGAPAHFTARTRDHLDTNFHNKWIGSGVRSLGLQDRLTSHH